MLLFLSWACQEERMTEAAKGAFAIALADDTLGVQTKAQTAISEELAAKFRLTIRNAAGYTIYDGGYTTDPIPAPNGQYTLEARMGQNPDLGWDAPYYVGRKEDVKVTAKETTSVAIPCTVGNALVSARWTNQEKIDKVFTNYGVKVMVNRTSALLTPEKGESKLYLKAGEQVSFYFVGTLISTGVEQIVPLQSEQLRSTLNPADHCILTLTVDDRLAMQIEKAEITRETINQTIPLEWLPKPKVEGFANQANLLTYVETADAIPAAISFSAAHTIQDIELTLALQDERLQSLNKTYLFSDLSEADAQALGEAGIALNRQEKGGNIDFTQMTARLITFKGEPVNNRIKLRVKANDRWSAEADAAPVYTIQTVKPEFSVSVDERNSWSREFTIEPATVATGNAEKIMSDLTYQYFDGTNWVDCQSREQVKGRLQQFTAAAEALSTKSYRVRALYRGVVTSTEATATLEEPTPIPNGGMEEWQQQSIKWDYPNYLPWSSGATELWNTNNEFTLRYSVAIKTSYNGFPAVSYSTAYKHGGSRSAELRNTAAGPVCGPNIVYDYNRVAGMLFLGDYTGTTSTAAIDGSISIDEGRPFNVRPSRLTYWYMYEPYGTDTYDMVVKVFDSENNVIGTCSYISSEAKGEWTQVTLSINYTSAAKAAKLYVFFESSNAGQGNVPYGKKRKLTLADDKERTTHYGSILRIDDIQLIYDK